MQHIFCIFDSNLFIKIIYLPWAIFKKNTFLIFYFAGPKKPLYSQVNKSKEPSDRKSMEIGTVITCC